MSQSGLYDVSVSVLIIPHHRRNYFKHFACYGSKCRVALKDIVDAAGIAVINLYCLPTNGALSQPAVTETPKILELWIIHSQYLLRRTYSSCGSYTTFIVFRIFSIPEFNAEIKLTVREIN